jgi:hypothetical protein
MIAIVNKVEKTSGAGKLSREDVSKIFDAAMKEHAVPITPIIRNLKQMNPAARYTIIKNHTKDMNSEQTAEFLGQLEVHGIKFEAMPEPQASLPSKQPQIAQVSPGKYQVTTRSGKVKTVTKNADGSLVIV